MRSDTGQCLGVHQTLLHCTELVLYANAKLGWSGQRDEATVEAGRKVGRADTEESVQWGVV